MAEDLRTGKLTADDIEIVAFRDPKTRKLIAESNRGLTALTMAGLKSTRVSEISATDKLTHRLSEPPVDRFHPVPGRRIAVTEQRSGEGHLYSVFLPNP